MYRFIFKKMFASIITLFVVVVLLYFLISGVKGIPITRGPEFGTDAEWQAELARLGLDKSIFERFISYVSGIFKGDWGRLYVMQAESEQTIPMMFFEPLKYSMMVAVPSYLFGMIIGLGLGYWAGYRRGKIDDAFINGFVTLFVAVPVFVFASYALIIGPLIGLPITFMGPWAGFSTSETISSLILPILVSTLTSLSFWTIYTRIDVAAILKTDYILAVRTKGFSEWKIFKNYVLRNAMYNYIGSISTMFMIVFGSSIVTERFFNVPGTASMLTDAMNKGEINIIMFNMIFFSTLGLGTEVISSIAIYSINPLVKASFSSKSSLINKIKAKKAREDAELIKISQHADYAKGGAND